jgi:hypothetical protein
VLDRITAAMAVLVALIYGMLSLAIEEPASFQDKVTRRLIFPLLIRLGLPCRIFPAQLKRFSPLFNRS